MTQQALRSKRKDLMVEIEALEHALAGCCFARQAEEYRVAIARMNNRLKALDAVCPMDDPRLRRAS